MIDNVNLSKQTHVNDPALKNLDEVHGEILKIVHGFKTYKEYDAWLRSKEGKAKTNRVESIIKQRFGITVNLVDYYGKIYAIAVPFKENNEVVKEKGRATLINKAALTAYHKQSVIDIDKVKITGTLSKVNSYILISYWDLSQDNNDPKILSVAVLNAVGDIINAFAMIKVSDSGKKDLYDLAESLGNNDKEQRKRAISNLLTNGIIDAETSTKLLDEDNNIYFCFKFIKGVFNNFINIFTNVIPKTNEIFLSNLGYKKEAKDYSSRTEKYADLFIKHFIAYSIWCIITVFVMILSNGAGGIAMVPAFVACIQAVFVHVYFWLMVFSFMADTFNVGSNKNMLAKKEAISTISSIVNVNGIDSFTRAKYNSELSEQTKLLEDSSKQDFTNNPIFDFFSSNNDNGEEGLLSSVSNFIKSGLNKIGIG